MKTLRSSLFLTLAAALTLATPILRLRAHDRVATKVTWEREISPIVQTRCVSCHSAGGAAPMPLGTYEEARPWARAIREEVLTRRMPLWHGVRGYGDYANDPSLSPFEIALITAWVDGGAPRTLPVETAVPAPVKTPAQWTPPRGSVRVETFACTAGRLPVGRVLGLEPAFTERGSLRLAVSQPDGAEEPVLWVREVAPGARQIYWLRNPLEVSPGTRVTVAASPGCRLNVLLEGGTAR